MVSVKASTPAASTVTLLGFGSLLSERSARITFPNLTAFRLGRVPSYRRVFAHPAAIFFERQLADIDTLRMSSLCAEPCAESSFVCSVFEVANEGFINADGDICDAFREREEEFHIDTVPFTDLNGTPSGSGILCCRSTDEAYVARWGEERFRRKYKSHGVNTIWGWQRDSGLKPCPTYLRHCLLAAENMGSACYGSFLDETYLVDRVTTIRQYLEKECDLVMNSIPPENLSDRYGG